MKTKRINSIVLTVPFRRQNHRYHKVNRYSLSHLKTELDGTPRNRIRRTECLNVELISRPVETIKQSDRHTSTPWSVTLILLYYNIDYYIYCARGSSLENARYHNNSATEVISYGVIIMAEFCRPGPSDRSIITFYDYSPLFLVANDDYPFMVRTPRKYVPTS